MFYVKLLQQYHAGPTCMPQWGRGSDFEPKIVASTFWEVKRLGEKKEKKQQNKKHNFGI